MEAKRNERENKDEVHANTCYQQQVRSILIPRFLLLIFPSTPRTSLLSPGLSLMTRLLLFSRLRPFSHLREQHPSRWQASGKLSFSFHFVWFRWVSRFAKRTTTTVVSPVQESGNEALYKQALFAKPQLTQTELNPRNSLFSLFVWYYARRFYTLSHNYHPTLVSYTYLYIP